MSGSIPDSLVKLLAPEPYHGKDPVAALAFLSRAKAFFDNLPTAVTRDLKFQMILGFLKDDAAVWALPYYAQLGGSSPCWADFVAFETDFKAHFCAVDDKASAYEELRQLNRGAQRPKMATVKEWTAKFTAIAARTGLGEEDKRMRYRDGLPEQLRTALITSGRDVSTFAKMQKEALEISQGLASIEASKFRPFKGKGKEQQEPEYEEEITLRDEDNPDLDKEPPSPPPPPSTPSDAGSEMNGNRPQELKANPPFEFNGYRPDASRWLERIRSYLILNGAIYDTDEKKIRYATSFMKGGAEPFSQQILDVQHARLFSEPPQPWNYTWETFQKDFKRNFISTDTKRDAYQQLRRIKQGSERIADYIHKFQRLSREAGLTDFTVLEQHFISGLNYKIHQALIPLMPVPHDTDETPMEALLKKTMSIGENIERNQSHQNDSGPRHVRHFRKRNQEYRNNYSGRFKKNHFKIRAMETDDTEEAQESDNEDIDEDPETNDEAAEEREICAQYFNH